MRAGRAPDRCAANPNRSTRRAARAGKRGARYRAHCMPPLLRARLAPGHSVPCAPPGPAWGGALARLLAARRGLASRRPDAGRRGGRGAAPPPCATHPARELHFAAESTRGLNPFRGPNPICGLKPFFGGRSSFCGRTTVGSPRWFGLEPRGGGRALSGGVKVSVRGYGGFAGTAC